MIAKVGKVIAIGEYKEQPKQEEHQHEEMCECCQAGEQLFQDVCDRIQNVAEDPAEGISMMMSLASALQMASMFTVNEYGGKEGLDDFQDQIREKFEGMVEEVDEQLDAIG